MHQEPVSSEKLEILAVNPELVPFPFGSRNAVWDNKNIMVDHLGIAVGRSAEIEATLCHSCHTELWEKNGLPKDALANHRWIGEVPDVLKRLTLIDQALVAQCHYNGCVIQLEHRKDNYHFVKGYMVLVPQDTSELLTLLPQHPAKLAETMKLVWVGKEKTDKDQVQSQATCHLLLALKALEWLCANHADYKNGAVEIDYAVLNGLPAVFLVDDLVNSMGFVSDSAAKDAARSGVAVVDPDNEVISGNLPFSASAILDTNGVGKSTDSLTLEELIRLKKARVSHTEASNFCDTEDTDRELQGCDEIDSLTLDEIHTSQSSSDTLDDLADTTCEQSPGNQRKEQISKVVLGNNVLHPSDTPSYYTSAYPCVFPYGTGGHIVAGSGRRVPLGRDRWGKLLLQHSSRRFQSHPMFAATCFNNMRLDRSSIGVKVQASYKTWQKTDENLESVTEQQLIDASAQSKNHQRISNPAVRDLLRLVSRIGTHAPGSDAKKSCMLVQLKSTIMKHGLPLIFLTLNPGERDSPLALYYAGADIDMKDFDPDQYPDEEWLSMMMDNPLATVEYFHNTVRAVLQGPIKGGMFGKLLQYYGVIEYQVPLYVFFADLIGQRNSSYSFVGMDRRSDKPT
jgi:Helitron helicase-like domain at N-terminus